MAEAPFNYANALAGSFEVDLRNEAVSSAALDDGALVGGALGAPPASFYDGFSQNDLSLWCVRRGYYSLPTAELVEKVAGWIGGDRAIEIGAGHGALGRALGIPTTDSKMQERQEISRHYQAIGQATTGYPASVEKLTAMEALEKYRPKVVVAAWVTHRFDPRRPERFGNMYGVDEDKLLDKPFVRRYIFVGHERVHQHKPILRRRHSSHKASFLHGRVLDRDKHVIWKWDV